MHIDVALTCTVILKFLTSRSGRNYYLNQFCTKCKKKKYAFIVVKVSCLIMNKLILMIKPWIRSSEMELYQYHVIARLLVESEKIKVAGPNASQNSFFCNARKLCRTFHEV